MGTTNDGVIAASAVGTLNLDGEGTAAMDEEGHLSIITNSEVNSQQLESVPNPRLDITEEAQMPKFNENSNGEEGEIVDSDDSEPD